MYHFAEVTHIFFSVTIHIVHMVPPLIAKTKHVTLHRSGPEYWYCTFFYLTEGLRACLPLTVTPSKSDTDTSKVIRSSLIRSEIREIHQNLSIHFIILVFSHTKSAPLSFIYQSLHPGHSAHTS